jgi:hypothetical protein
MRRLIPGALLLAALAATAGCDNNNSVTTPTNPTTPTTPTTPATTETFSGTLTLNGSQIYPFTATSAGTVAATLTTEEPDSTLLIGLSLGSWSGTACQISIDNAAAAQSAVITGTVTAAAALCVRVYDAKGNIPASQPVNFTVTIAHP